MPYNTADKILANLEEKAHANVIPKISIFSVAKGYDKPTVVDIK